MERGAPLEAQRRGRGKEGRKKTKTTKRRQKRSWFQTLYRIWTARLPTTICRPTIDTNLQRWRDKGRRGRSRFVLAAPRHSFVPGNSRPKNYNHPAVSTEYLDPRRQFLQLDGGRPLPRGNGRNRSRIRPRRTRGRERRGDRSTCARSAIDHHILCDFHEKNSLEFSASFGSRGIPALLYVPLRHSNNHKIPEMVQQQ